MSDGADQGHTFPQKEDGNERQTATLRAINQTIKSTKFFKSKIKDHLSMGFLPFLFFSSLR